MTTKRTKIHWVFNPRTGKEEPSEYPQTQADAITQKSTMYQPIGEDPCPTCGMYSVRFTISGACRLCANHAAVRDYQAAIAAGEPTTIDEATARGLSYYWNGKENAHCGHNGKVTLTGKCFTCANQLVAARPIPIHEQFPDLLLSYEDAKALGFKTYRTGEACKRGHTGWRYVSTRGCIDCKSQ